MPKSKVPSLPIRSNFGMPGVLHGISDMRGCDLPDVSVLALRRCAP